MDQSSKKTPTPLPALEMLIDGLFDYAGMYPPASLSYEATRAKLSEFQEKATRPHLLHAHLVLDIPHLGKLAAEKAAAAPWLVAVLGTPLSLSAPATVRDSELSSLTEATLRPSTLRAASYEVRIEPELANDLERLFEHASALNGSLPDNQTVLAIEPNLSTPNGRQALEAAAATVHRIHASTPFRCALKIRGAGSAGSGSTGIDCRQFIHVLRLVTALEIPLKATAGLHHPILEPERYGNVLGFLNLKSALMLVAVYGEKISDSELLKCLSESSPAAYSFENLFRWRNWEVDLVKISTAQKLLPLTIGSCSLEEPDADLVRLFGPARRAE